MINKKILITMSTCALAGMLVLGGSNVYANYPENYHGASASSLTFTAEGTATYSGNTVTIPVKLKQEKAFSFMFDNVSELYPSVANEQDEIDSSIESVDTQSGVVNLSFDISQAKLDTPYMIRVYTDKMFGRILEPEDITFKMNDKVVNISSEGKLTVTKNNDVNNESVTETDQKVQKEEVNKEDNEKESNVATNDKSSKQINPHKKSLPATTAVK